MPNYDYECVNCGNAFTIFQPMTAEPIKQCPKCSQDVKRLIGSGSGIIFKGSGFYETDYKRKKSEAKSENSKKGKGASESPCSNCPSADKGCPAK